MHPVAAHLDDGLGFRLERRPRRKGDPARGGRGLPWLHLSLGCGAAIAVIACFAERHEIVPTDMPEVPHRLSAAAPLPAWTPVPRPLPIYGIEASPLKSLPFAFSARRDPAGAREDTLAFGAFDHVAGPHLRIMLHRSPDPGSLPTLFLDLARRASEAGLAVMRSTPPEGLATKFGVMETSEVALSDSPERACLAFRFAHGEVGFRVTGWLCPAHGQAIDRQEVACTLDRLSLIEPGNDEPLKNLFAQADRQRIGGCPPAPTVAGADARKAGRPKSRPPPAARPARAQAAVTAAQKGSATLRRGTARAADSASPDNRG